MPARATMAPNSWLTIERRSSVISSAWYDGPVPTSSVRMRRGSRALSVYEPNARTRSGPSSGSLTMTGFGVPHLRSVTWRVAKK